MEDKYNTVSVFYPMSKDRKIEDSNFEVFYHPSNGIDYKKYLYVFHPVINKISIQVFFFDEESTIFRTFDNPKSN